MKLGSDSRAQGHVAKVCSVAEVECVRCKLMENGKIARATHNIMAYRIAMQNGVVLQVQYICLTV